MAYGLLDDGFAEHPKIVGLSDAAFRAHVEVLCFCFRTLSDGRVPVRVTERYRPTVVSELITAGLWERNEQTHYHIHDYLDHNPSREEVLQRRADAKKRKERWRERVTERVTDTHPTPTPTPTPTPNPTPTRSVPSERVLFAGAPSTKKPKKTADPRIQSLKTAWIAFYKTATGEEPATFNHGAWGSLCRVALKTHDEPTILERANAFFGSQRAKMQAFRFEAFFKDFATLNGKPKAGMPDWLAELPEGAPEV